jgi:DNA-binding transcriptional regulator YiaG
VSIVSTLKAEIDRLAAKQAKRQVAKAQKAAAKYRHKVAELKRLLRQKEKEIKRLEKTGSVQSADDNPLIGTRFSARSVRAQRQRLGLSAADYGRLIGVTALAVHHWEQSKARPRKAQLAALIAIRGIPKCEAMAKLASR